MQRSSGYLRSADADGWPAAGAARTQTCRHCAGAVLGFLEYGAQVACAERHANVRLDKAGVPSWVGRLSHEAFKSEAAPGAPKAAAGTHGVSVSERCSPAVGLQLTLPLHHAATAKLDFSGDLCSVTCSDPVDQCRHKKVSFLHKLQS